MLSRSIRSRIPSGSVAAVQTASLTPSVSRSSGSSGSLLRTSRVCLAGAARFKYPQHNIGMGVHQPKFHAQYRFDLSYSDVQLPASQSPAYENVFEHKLDAKTWPTAWETKGHDKVSVPVDLCESHQDPHNRLGFGQYSFDQYNYVREPVFPRKPNPDTELVAGANSYRTTAFKEWEPTKSEPAIVQVCAFSPDNFRHVDLCKNMPWPASSHHEGMIDFMDARLPIGHADRKPFVYFCAAGFMGLGALLIRHWVVKLVWWWWPKKSVFTAGSTDVNLREIEMGQNFVTKWRGKAVFVKRRPADQIALARKDDAIVASMRDPEKDEDRCIKPEWLIMSGACTHLGCIPFPDAGDFGGWFCPCHGSHYDYSGRIRKGPAPSNLPIPEYQFLDEFTVRIG